MSHSLESLLRVCRIDDLEQIMTSLAAAWAQMCRLSSCRIELVDLPPTFGWTDLTTVAGNGTPTRADSTASEPSGAALPSPLPMDGAVELWYDGVVVARVWGSPADHLQASSPEVQSTSAWLIGQALRFRGELTRQKLEAMAEFAAGAAHEINNPLGTIIGRAQQLLSGESDPERRRLLETIGAQAYRIRDMIGDTMLFGRPPEPKLQLLDLHEHVRLVTGKFAEQFHRRRISLFQTDGPSSRVAPGEQIFVRADPVQLSVLISELVRNALDAVADLSGAISIELHTHRAGDRDWAVMRVADNGGGLCSQAQEHLFDPFYSGRQAGRGLGFGLSKCWRIVQLHGGTICAATPAGGGLEVIVHWPLAAADR